MTTRFLVAAGCKVRIKLCGMTSHREAALAAELGADAIGLVFHAQSARNVSIPQAAEIARGLPADLTVTALFVDKDEQFVKEAIAALPVHLLQFHGSENAEFCRSFQLPYMKAIRPDPRRPESGDATPYRDAFAILWDTYDKSVPGGSGRRGDWSALPGLISHQRNVVAGGLNPGNVASAINATKPYAVDVSSGIEESPGSKSPELMSSFIREVRDVS